MRMAAEIRDLRCPTLPEGVGVRRASVFTAVDRPERLELEVVDTDASPSLELTIKGMTCSHCVSSVKRGLLECPGVEAVEVDLAGGWAEISGSELDPALLCKVVGELGYSAETGSDESSAEV